MSLHMIHDHPLLLVFFPSVILLVPLHGLCRRDRRAVRVALVERDRRVDLAGPAALQVARAALAGVDKNGEGREGTRTGDGADGNTGLGTGREAAGLLLGSGVGRRRVGRRRGRSRARARPRGRPRGGGTPCGGGGRRPLAVKLGGRHIEARDRARKVGVLDKRNVGAREKCLVLVVVLALVDSPVLQLDGGVGAGLDGRRDGVDLVALVAGDNLGDVVDYLLLELGLAGGVYGGLGDGHHT